MEKANSQSTRINSMKKLKYIRHITGRREEHTFMEIFVWKKKSVGEEGSGKFLESIVELVEKEVTAN